MNFTPKNAMELLTSMLECFAPIDDPTTCGIIFITMYKPPQYESLINSALLEILLQLLEESYPASKLNQTLEG